VLDCLRILAEESGLTSENLLKQCTYFAHGSTVVTNAVIERKVAKVGFLVTHGFRDILTLREGGKDNPFNPREHFPKPFVPRYLTLPVTERIDAEGEVVTPLDEAEAKEAARILIEQYRVDTIGVCFLWSIANPKHETRVKDLISDKWPGVTCILSSDVNPIIREYRRAISTAIEASVRPIAEKYINTLNRRLKDGGFRGTLYIVTSSGAVLAAEDAAQKGVSMIASGPAMAPVAAKWFGALEGNVNGNVISIDMGGTSLDVSLVSQGEIARTRESKLGSEMLGLSVIDARSIGAGGGSIAWIDPAGLIHVGPESAGAIPGPACYNRGGAKPTVTDANVVLGYIDPEYFLGKRMRISPELAEEVVQRDVAAPLHLDLHEAAFTIWSTVNVNMVSAIQEVTVWQGIDPREYLLLAGGGAAGCHAASLARDLGMKKILVPRYGGVLSAVGGLIADVSAEFTGSLFTSTGDFDHERVNRLLEDLENRAHSFLTKLGGAPVRSRVEFFVDARYSYQVWEIAVQLRNNRIDDRRQVAELCKDFHDVHQRIFGIKEPGQLIECILWTARAVAETPEFQLSELSRSRGNASCAPIGKRNAYFKEAGGLVRTAIYHGDSLQRGHRLIGPSIIEEATATIVIPPGCAAEVTGHGDYLIDINY
jgi:N-methylhydantoinase A